MIVVSDSLPLIALARIGRLNLLASFYKQLLIPADVYKASSAAFSYYSYLRAIIGSTLVARRAGM